MESLEEMVSAFKGRRDGQRIWLREHHPECFSEQKHLAERSAERAYWHYGYMVALSDVLAQLTGVRG